jgi:hypothetical protein
MRPLNACEANGSKFGDLLAASSIVPLMYDPPYRVLYTLKVVGCRNITAYLVACNNKTPRRAAGIPSE